jgi:hypothetical protein
MGMIKEHLFYWRADRVLYISIVAGGIIYFILFGNFLNLAVFVFSIILFEFFSFLLINFLSVNPKTKTIIVKDKIPNISESLIDKFYEHGFDPELGWIRKKNTMKTDMGKPYTIDEYGARANREHAHLPLLVSCYGDSYTFCREVNDNQTWPWYLSEKINAMTLNFGVGNYGLDQALIRLKREYPINPTPVVIMAVVPDTLARILSVWKHYSEHGNILGFKPRYVLDGDDLKLVPNVINTRDKFLKFANYLTHFEQYDYFYQHVFKKNAFCFPYGLAVLIHVRKLIILFLIFARKVFKGSVKLTDFISRILVCYVDDAGPRRIRKLYKDNTALALLVRQVEEFFTYASEKKFLPLFVILPMKDDLIWMKHKGCFYQPLFDKIKNKLPMIDLAADLLKQDNFDKLFNKWHYSQLANQIVAEQIKKGLYFYHGDKLKVYLPELLNI